MRMQFDLHVHSVHSPDSLSTLAALADAARERGLTGLALTDHGTTADADAARFLEGRGLWCIRGNEVQTELGDILGLFLSGPVRSGIAERVIDEIHDQGGLAVLAHPFKYIREYPPQVLKKLDAVEIANARWKDLQDLRREGKVGDLLGRVCGRTAGSDAHFPFEVGRACLVTAPLAGPAELMACIRSGEGKPAVEASSGWLDEASQCTRFLKRPSPKQLARILYRSARRLAGVPHSGLS